MFINNGNRFLSRNRYDIDMFPDGWKLLLRRELLRIERIGLTRIPHRSVSSQFGRQSGPKALVANSNALCAVGWSGSL